MTGSAAMAAIDASTAQELSDARTMLETYRAQIEQCEKLKVELDLIHDAIDRTKREIATLHGKSFDGERDGQGQWRARRGGRRHRTGDPADPRSRRVDRPGGQRARPRSTRPTSRSASREEIQERVISIFEACNFQDLTGQRISKVMGTMKFIEQHINAMMEIWGGVDAIKCACRRRIVDTRERATTSCSTARSSTATSATPRRTTSTRCSTKRTRQRDKQNAGASRRFLFWPSLRAKRSNPDCCRESRIWIASLSQ